MPLHLPRWNLTTRHKHSSFRPHCLAATHDIRLIVIVSVICVVIVVIYESSRCRGLEDAELEERETEELGATGDWRY